MFCFTSFGARIDHSVNSGRGPYTFRINGQNYHRIGSLLPAEGVPPRYAQLYFFDTQNEIRNRMSAFMSKEAPETVDENIVANLIQMLDQTSAMAKSFRMAKEWCRSHGDANFGLRLLSERTTTRQYNAPTVSEVSALIINDFGDGLPIRDIVVNKNNTGPQRISELHPSYMALQYPLLFPFGEDGYHENIPYNTNKGTRKTKRGYVTMKEYYAYIIQQRQNQGTTLLRGGRLFLQYLVDAFTAIEEQRLNWTRNNQDTLRVDLYHNLCDAVTRGDTSAAGLGKRIVLPRTYVGSPRYMMHNYYDAMALCQTYGNLDMFITFTSNLKWPEIAEMLAYIPGQKSHDRPEIGTRVFKMKLIGLLEDLTKHHIFGKYCAETVINEDGYPVYRRRDNKITAFKGKFTYDNRHVVPHNRYLLLKYRAHINVEWCNRSKAIKYKGPDRATIAIQENVKVGANGESDQIMVIDEIKNYLNCRFLSPCEAVWRLFSFDINYAYPTVMQLNYHLPDQNAITLRDSEHLPALLEREGISITMFTEWIVYATPASGEQYFRRMLLNVVRGAQSFTDLKMVNKINYATCKAACFAYGLLDDDKEWTHAIIEAKNWVRLSEDILNKKRKQYRYPELNLPDEQVRNYCLLEIQYLLNTHGKSLSDFKDLPQPDLNLLTNLDNRLLREALSFDANKSIASLLLPAGRIAHSIFIIPLELMENNTCGIKQGTHLAELLQHVRLIIWDEAPMTQRYAFEALHKTLQDILGYQNQARRNRIFGGMTVLLGGDFRQTLPVIPNAKRPKIVAETYPDFTSRQGDDEYLTERAILTLRNDEADAINEHMFKKLGLAPVTYNSADKICKASTYTTDQHDLYPVEFLNSLNFQGMPPMPFA
ncbi:AT-hook motif-containing protein [Tanacetum coccineum]